MSGTAELSARAVSTTESVFAAALRGERCQVVSADGTLFSLPRELPVERWRGGSEPGDLAVLAHCVGPTLDIGCGPGRMTEQLAGLGHLVLGIDIVGEAVRQTCARGVPALIRDVFAPVPGEGRWRTALLADGNIGIGGHPRRLLARVAGLLGPGGRVVTDLAPSGVGLRTGSVRLRTATTQSVPFAWSVVGADAIDQACAGTGLAVESLLTAGERWFAVLAKQGLSR